jgi:hypothetical protein
LEIVEIVDLWEAGVKEGTAPFEPLGSRGQLLLPSGLEGNRPRELF